MQIPLKQPESTPENSNPDSDGCDCDPVEIAKAAVALQERKMQIMGKVFDKVTAYEERAEQRVQSWLDRARQWQEGGQ